MEKRNIKELVEQLNLEEKAALCSGKGFWDTQDVKRLGIPSIRMADGPHGLRKQEEHEDSLGLEESIPAVCFPSGSLSAASFDRELLKELGETLGRECQAEHIGLLLGPSMNIKRSPLGGRNFEYYSEDPMLSSELAAAYIEGVQSQHVGTCPKHFFGNNQESRRTTVTSDMDERTMREIYLASFEHAVKKARPWAIMGACNRVNGTGSTENRAALTGILRGEWGFDGFALSDWGIIRDRVNALDAGLDLEMPSSYGYGQQKIIDAVKSGGLGEDVLNQSCERILEVVFRYNDNCNKKAAFDREKDHEVARRIAEESMVLLKNEGVLPLSPTEKIAFIGHYAKEPRYQGSGSSHIQSSKVVTILDMVSGWDNIVFKEGFREEEEEADEALLAEAVRAAEESDVAVLFIGLPERDESEGFDRVHMRLPQCQNALIEAVCTANSRVVVVLHNGAPVEMPWADKVQGILESYLAGQAVGEAQYRILFGEVNPSGRLAETFPLRLADNPTYPWYGAEGDNVAYREGIFVGYRYYDAKHMDVLFPFGHGLSYTEFRYSNLEISADSIKDTDTLEVSCEVTNTGRMAGKEVVQLYVAQKNPEIPRPIKELRGFEKIYLKPGETGKVCFQMDKRAFAYWNTALHDWHVETGDYEIMLGKSSRVIMLRKELHVESTAEVPYAFTRDSTFGDVMRRAKNREAVMEVARCMGADWALETGDAYGIAVMRDVALRMMVGYMGVQDEDMKRLLKLLNE